MDAVQDGRASLFTRRGLFVDYSLAMLKRVYLDSNWLEGVWPGTPRGEVLLLFVLSRRADVAVCIPESVATERSHSLPRRASELLDQVEKDLRAVNSMLNGVIAPIQIVRPTVEQIREAHDRTVEITNQRYRVSVTPLTTRSLTAFLTDAAQHRAPFKNEDQGFRDAVHLHSVIEDLKRNVVEGGHDSVFLSKDKRLSGSDVKSLIADEGVPLSVVSDWQTLYQRLLSQVGPEIRSTLVDLAALWASPALLEDIRKRLLPIMLAGFQDLPINENERVRSSLSGFVEWEPAANSFAPGAQENEYVASLEVRVYVDAIIERLQEIPGGRRGYLRHTGIVFLVGIDSEFLTKGHVQLDGPVKYTSARAFSVATTRDERGHWQFQSIPDPVELIAAPVGGN